MERPTPNQPIPSHAKKVFSGVIHDVYQWEQQMYDGSTATFEKIKRTDTIAVIPITIDGKIIVCEEQQPGYKNSFYTFPGGRLDADEDPMACAKRELMEETGYTCQEMMLWDASNIVPKVDCVSYTFIAVGCERKNDKKLDNGEMNSVKFVEFVEMMDILMGDNFRGFVQTILFAKALYNKGKNRDILELLGYKNELTN